MNNETVLQEVRFNPKVKIYWYIQGLWIHFLLILCLIGVLTFPVWLVAGWWIVGKRFDLLSATLTDSSIHLRKGYFNRVEKTVPLDKIQDLGLRTGPLLNLFALTSIHIETAGSTAQGTADMVLSGVIEADVFRNRVLEQRGIVSSRLQSVPIASDSALLAEIRDSLIRIEVLLGKKNQ